MNYPEHILHQVEKPGRYTGGEWNSVCKEWSKTPLKVALSFPDTYEIGMSNLAIPLLYDILNRNPDILAERVFS
ncbi:MAG: B12-binding domain-containing radical SAM protein, partial [Dehalococcoides mccartyi]